jgi:hypothetical protein
MKDDRVPRREQDAQEAKKYINVSVGYKSDINEMLVFLSQRVRRHMELAENVKEKVELEKRS